MEDHEVAAEEGGVRGGDRPLLRQRQQTLTGAAKSSFLWLRAYLIWQGHEFLEAAKDSETWIKAKRLLTCTGGGIVFDVLKAVLIEISKRAALAALT
jgi:hypothetical protein